ncbi:MAG TPA: hypothetical protein VG815_22080, partial [Chloroflexota bacterium]|nr:hypothetical protein [Chloroflexota bacterium]
MQVTVSDTSTDPQAGSVSKLAFSGGDPLRLNPTGAITVVKAPPPPSPFTLAPGQSRSFSYELRAANLGSVLLSSDVSGQDAAGGTVTASANTTVVVGKGLSVDLTYAPTTIKVPVDDKGNDIPQPFDLKVKVTNNIGKTVTGVKLDKLPVLEKMGADVAVPIEQNLRKKQPSLDLGTLAPKQSASATFPFLAGTDGQGRVTWTANATDPANPNGAIKGVGSTVVSIDPTVVLRLDVNLRTPPASAVKSGDVVTVGGVVTNITNADVVDLDPIDPILSGNAGNASPYDPDKPPPDGAFPVPIEPKLAPAAVQAFNADVQTIPDQGAWATVQYQLTGKIEKPDGTTDKIEQDQVLYAPDHSQRISIDDSAQTVNDPSTLMSQVANFSIGWAESDEDWFRSTFAPLAWLYRDIPATGEIGYDALVQKAPLELLQCIDYSVTWWNDTTPEQRSAFYDRLATDIYTQNKKIEGATWADVRALIEHTLGPWLNNLAYDWGAGNYNAVARGLGQIWGNLALQAAMWRMHVPDSETIIKMSDIKQQAGLAKRLPEDIAALKDGDNLMANGGTMLSTLFGLTPQQFQNLAMLAKEKGLLIAVRFRNALSIAWEKLGAIVKMEAVKLKSVDRVDVEMLGYRAGDPGVGDEGAVVLKRPLGWNSGNKTSSCEACLRALMNSPVYLAADDTAQAAGVIRLKARIKEWNDFLKNEPGYNYSEMAKPIGEGGGIVVPENYQGFNYKANGSAFPPYDPTVAAKKPFRLITPDGQLYPHGDYWLAEVEMNGKWVRITGDIDIVAITPANAGTLTPSQKLDIYQTLQDLIDIQHGDTFNWLENGELSGPHATALLNDHVPGKEPVVVFDPEGNALVNHIQPKYTFWNAKDLQGRIWFTHGYRNPLRTIYHFGQLAFPPLDAAETIKNFFTPASWASQIVQPPDNQSQRVNHVHTALVPASNTRNSILGGRCTWRFNASPAAGAIMPNGTGGLVQWTPKSGWKSLDLRSCWYNRSPASGSPLGSDHILSVLPQTSLQAYAPKSATTLTINDLATIDPQLSSKAAPWFQAGQRIVLDPGAADQQVVTIRAVQPGSTAETLTLSGKLT